MSVTGQQCRAGRAMLGWSLDDLAREAAVDPALVAQVESGQPVENGVLDALAGALQKAGLVLIEDNQTSAAGGPGVRLLRSPGQFDTDPSQTVQYKEHLAPDAPTGAGG